MVVNPAVPMVDVTISLSTNTSPMLVTGRVNSAA